MKGKLIKINGEWMVEYDYHHVHAGISKMGTGPGVGKKIIEKKQLSIHPISVRLMYSHFLEEGSEVEWEISKLVLHGDKGPYASLILTKSQETWDEIFGNSYKEYIKSTNNPDGFPKWLKDNYLPPKRMKS